MSSTTAPSSAARTMSILGFVFGAVAILFIPILFGPAAIVLGIVAKTKGDPLGLWAAIVGAVGLVVGWVLGALVLQDAVEAQALALLF